MPLLILSYLPALICGIHAVRTGQQMYWIFILVVGGPLGALIYFFAIMLPDLSSGRTARGAAKAARKAIDPQADYRKALAVLEETPTADARIRAAQAAAALGRWEDAESQWALAASGYWASDPVILLGHAVALLETGRHADALARLEELGKVDKNGETPQAALAFARAYEGLGRHEEADAPYRFAADRVPGLEAGARYVAFMAKTGRIDDARIGLDELERRYQKIARPLRGEAKAWRDLAAEAVKNHSTPDD